jgi:heptosyltransferase III
MGEKKVSKTVIIHQGALGDLVCTAPALAALRAHSGVLLGIGSVRLKLLESAGTLDKAVSAESASLHRLFLDNFEPGPYLNSLFQDAELAVSWMGKGSAVFKKNLRTLCSRSFFFEQSIQGPQAGHICRTLAAPVLEAGIAVEDFWPRLELPEQSESALPVGPEDFIAVHPGSGSAKKTVPLDKLFRVLLSLKDIFQSHQFVVVAGDADKTLLIELVKRMPVELRPRIQIVENADLLTLARVLKKAALFIGADSGPAHLAAALGTRTLVVFGPTDPKVWAPPQAWARYLAPDLPCAPCAEPTRRDCQKTLCLEQPDERKIIESAGRLLQPG